MKLHKNIQENAREVKECKPTVVTVILSDATKWQWRIADFRYIRVV